MPYRKDKPMINIFEEIAEKYPNNDALIFNDTHISYMELNEKANSLANYLLTENINKEDIISICINRSVELVVSILAVLKIGATYLPVDPTMPKDRINHMLSDSSAKLMLSTENIDLDISIKRTNVDLDKIIYTFYSKENLNLCYDLENSFIAIYTSGSTGMPKGSVLKNLGLNNLIYGFEKEMNYTFCKRFLSISSISFDMFIVETLLPLCFGICIVLANDEEMKLPISLGNLIQKYNIDFMVTTPSKIQLLIDYSPNCLNNFKKILLGGEVFTKKLFKDLSALTSADLYNGYGPSETTACCSIKKVLPNQDITIGHPMPNTKIYILDKSNNLAPIGAIGELCISGDCVGKGYINKKDLNKEKFISTTFDEGPIYKSGDLAKMLDNGEISFIGRNDLQIKLRGLRIELSEIEKVFLLHKNISKICILAKKLGLVKQLVAYYTTKNGKEIEDIRAFISQKLPAYMVPNYIIKIDNMPLNSSGKIDRNKLLDLEIEVSSSNYVPPRNPLEKTLCNIWSGLLGCKVGIDDNFFELGADSLLSITFKTQLLKHDIDTNISYGDLFKYPTIRLLSDNCLIPNEEKKDSTLYDVNYKKIHKTISINTIKQMKNNFENEEICPLLLGVTGFVGAHILASYIDNYKGKIYCLIRKKERDFRV